MAFKSLALLAPLPFLAGAALAQTPLESLPPEFQTELAGIRLEKYPHFTNVSAFNEGSPIRIGIDTLVEFRISHRTVNVYITNHRSMQRWKKDRDLQDVRGAPTRVTLVPGGLKRNMHVIDNGSLNGQTGTTELGVGYDVVVDMNLNGLLDDEDKLDGWGEEAGFYVVQDLTEFGPYETLTGVNNQGGFIIQKFYYPENIAQLGALPLIVVSHGNGHDYRWYDHIGHFMASWGYVVMSHRNNTGPGIEAASTTTLRNTNNFLVSLGTIAGGVLAGHVDRRQLVWIGHSRGGEGVVRAYRRILDGDPLGASYAREDFKLISSIAPVNFLLPTSSDPGDVNYHLWTGGSDNDVNGCADCNPCQTFHLHERATGTRLSTSLHGVGHGDFHDGGGSSVATGPCRVGRETTHQIMRGYLLPLVKHFVEGNIPCKDYLWRQWESFRPIGAPDGPCVVVDLMYQSNPNSGKSVLDDFQTNPQRARSSSGGSVVFSDPNLSEGPFDDRNGGFGDDASDPMNGMTLAGFLEFSSGITFEWNGQEEFVLFEVPADRRDISGFRYLSFRAAQSTRHPLTTAVLEDLTLSVQLVDAEGRSGTICIGAYGGGIEEPYQRRRCGGGRGWANEFETIRIPLRDFLAMGTRVDLTDIVGVSFLTGPAHGSPEGRIGLDEIEFTNE